VIAAAKFLLLGLVLSNYDSIFRSVNGAFNQVAAAISPNDWASNWMLQVNQYFNGLGNTGAIVLQRSVPIGMPCGFRQAPDICRKALSLWAWRNLLSHRTILHEIVLL
jgi:hypothetical protein